MDSMPCREKISLSSKILIMEGHGDFNLGHVSARDYDGSIWIKPAGMGQEEISASDVISINVGGEVIQGERQPHSEVPIHTAIYRRRPDIRCIVHTHPPNAIALGATGSPLAMLCHDAIPFYRRLGYLHDMPGLIVTAEQGDRLANILGGGNAVLIRNHGIVTAGRTVEEALCLAIHLERACKIQLLCNGNGIPVEDETAANMWDEVEKTALNKYNGFFTYLCGKLIRSGLQSTLLNCV